MTHMEFLFPKLATSLLVKEISCPHFSKETGLSHFLILYYIPPLKGFFLFLWSLGIILVKEDMICIPISNFIFLDQKSSKISKKIPISFKTSSINNQFCKVPLMCSCLFQFWSLRWCSRLNLWTTPTKLWNITYFFRKTNDINNIYSYFLPI